MCGIAGVVFADRARAVDELSLRRMARAVRHRGPDGYGIATDAGAGFVSTRLAIFDIPGGWQPMLSEDERSLMIYNGEVYNHYELRAEATKDGRPLRTGADTEVVHRLLDREGPAALDRFNGQWALAHWRRDSRELLLVRDRFGVRPLFYAQLEDGSLVFASEAKALFASGLVRAEPDPDGIDEVFTFWAARPPRTVFKGVRLLRPGHLLTWREGRVEERCGGSRATTTPARHEDLDELLRDSVRLRLRADVPVGTYLSGGLDSSLTTALRGRADRSPAAHLLGRLPRPALRRERLPARGGGRAGLRSTT